MPFQVVSSWVGLAVETTRGTAVAPTVFIPATAIDLNPNQAMLEDKGMRGSMVSTYQTVQGFRHDEEKWSGPVYLDTFPHLIRACLGSPDTVTGSSAPWTHTFSLLNNTASVGNQPPSYTITDFAGDKARQLTAGQLDGLSLKFDASGLLEYDVNFLANPYADMAASATPTPSFTTIFPVAAWSCAVNMSGGSSTRLMNGQIDMKRNVKPIATMNASHIPYRLWAAACDVTGKATAVFEDETDLNAFINNTQPQFQLVFTDTNTPTNTITVNLPKAAYLTGKPTRSGDFITADLTFTAIPTSGAATAGGVSPVSIGISNQQSTSY